MIRKLSIPESAYTYCNEQSPLSAVIVLHVEGKLDTESLVDKLTLLQARHKLLQASVQENGKGYFFEKLVPLPSIPLACIERIDAHTWKSATEEALNTCFEIQGPLMNCKYIRGKGEEGEILLVLHHSIIDGQGARLILVDFLKLLGGEKLRILNEGETVHIYPKEFQRLSGFMRKMAFMGKQMLQELSFFAANGLESLPAHSENGIMSFNLEKEISQKIIRKTGELGLSINSLIAAAMLLALSKVPKLSIPEE